MKLKDLVEMAIRGGDLTKQADEWAEKVETHLSDAEDNPVIGKIDDLTVRQRRFTLSVWDDTKMVMAASVDEVPGHFCKVDDIWIKAENRGQKLLVKLLLFLKNTKKCSRLVLGEVHSDDTYELLKRGGLKAFKKTWQNHKGEVIPFDSATIDDYYKSGGWSLTLENTEDWSRFSREGSFTHSYSTLSNIVDTYESLQ